MDVLEQRNDNAQVCQIEAGLLSRAYRVPSRTVERFLYRF